MSSGGGSGSAIQALPASTLNRSQNDLRGFVKTGAVAGGKDNPGTLDATRSVVQQRFTQAQDGTYLVKRSPGMSDQDYAQAQADADDINRRKGAAANFANVGSAGSKTVLGG